MSNELWIVVRNWRRFQHYRDRRPPWIKNWTGLVADQNYLALSASRRALLHGLWLLYALNDTSLRLDVHLINTSLGLHAKMKDYESLSHAGFITIVASKPLALAREQESEEERTRKGKDTQSQSQSVGYDFRRTPSRARDEGLIHNEETWSSATWD